MKKLIALAFAALLLTTQSHAAKLVSLQVITRWINRMRVWCSR